MLLMIIGYSFANKPYIFGELWIYFLLTNLRQWVNWNKWLDVSYSSSTLLSKTPATYSKIILELFLVIPSLPGLLSINATFTKESIEIN